MTRTEWNWGTVCVLAVAAFIAGLSFIGEQRRELAAARMELSEIRATVTRLSVTCATAQAGERLVATVPDYQNGGQPKCLYTRQSGYGRGASTVIARGGP